MRCPRCGAVLEDGARFCGGCGDRMAAPAAASPSPVAAGIPAAGVASGAPAFVPPRPPPTGPAPAHLAPAHVAPPRASGTPGAHLATPPPAAARVPTPAPGPARAPTPQPDPPRFATPPPGPSASALPTAPPRVAAAGGDPFIGQTLNNRYRVEAKLGEGGFGAVYRGRQLQVGREVALKLLHPDMARDPNLIARFRREGAVACNLRDAHTITTFDFDQTPDGTLYIAMELLKGRSLQEIFQAEAPIAWDRVLRIVEQVCGSLGEAHLQGIVHRDIKPENIYLEERPGHPDYVKVLDFGIAKIVGGEIGGQSPQLTATGQTLGTLEYMSPEQLMGKQLDGRSDLYALGVVSYELMTGRLPFPDAGGPAQLIAAQLKRIPDAPSRARPDAAIAHGADAIVLRMLEKDRGRRFADVNELVAAIHEVLAANGALPAFARGAAPAAAGAPAAASSPPGPNPGPGRGPAAPPSYDSSAPRPRPGGAPASVPPGAMARPGPSRPPGAAAMGPPSGANPMLSSSGPRMPAPSHRAPGAPGAPLPLGGTEPARLPASPASRLWLWLLLAAVVAVTSGVVVFLALR